MKFLLQKMELKTEKIYLDIYLKFSCKFIKKIELSGFTLAFVKKRLDP